MGQCIANGADVEVCMDTAAFQLAEVQEVLSRRVPAAAEAVYQAEFLGMAIDHLPFFTWSALQDRADKGALLSELSDGLRAAGEDSQLRFELLGAAVQKLDLGLDRLSRAIAAVPPLSRTARAPPSRPRPARRRRCGAATPPMSSGRSSMTDTTRPPLALASAIRAAPPPTSRRPTARSATWRGRRTWNATRSGGSSRPPTTWEPR